MRNEGRANCRGEWPFAQVLRSISNIIGARSLCLPKFQILYRRGESLTRPSLNIRGEVNVQKINLIKIDLTSPQSSPKRRGRLIPSPCRRGLG